MYKQYRDYLRRKGQIDGAVLNFGRLEKFSCKDTIATIVIPAYNEEKNIGLLLDTLVAQYGCPHSFNIIIVDNNSTDDTKRRILEAQYRCPFPCIHYLFEEEQGVSSARKAGYDEIIYTLEKEGRAREQYEDYYILSMDADTVTISKDWVAEYVATFKEDKVDMLSGDSKFDLEPLKDMPILHHFIEVKSKLENFTIENFTPRGEGCDMGFTANSYVEVGGVKLLYYPYKGKMFQSPSDDWNLSLDFLSHGKKIGFCDSGLVTSSRKFLSSIDEMIGGRIYDANWEELSKKEKRSKDITIEEYDALMIKVLRGIIAYNILLGFYVRKDRFEGGFCKKFDLLVSGPSDYNCLKFLEDLDKTRKIYYLSLYNDEQSYFAPARYLYMKFYEPFYETLALNFQQDIFKFSDSWYPIEELQVPRVKKESSSFRNDPLKYDQYLYNISLGTKTIDDFGDF